MSDVAKKARAAMKAKAQRLGSDRPLEKVDSSTWTPGPLINAQAKTGMRPISRRQFKKGGKVMGDVAPQRADRVQRAGAKPVTPDSFVNKNVKEANEERPGIKHIGGMKKGGRAKREDGGSVADYDTGSRTGAGAVTQSRSKPTPPMPQRRPPEPDYDEGSHTGHGTVTQSRKAGGRTKKEDGGGMGPAIAGAAKMMRDSGRGVPSDIISSVPATSRLSRSSGMGLKKGGVAHEDVAADKALIKKMVKPSARTGKDEGGEADNDDGMKKGGRAKRATGGQVFSGSSYPGKVPGAVPGGRTARATGGKTKGKTAINIVINAGKPPGQDGMMPPGGPPMPPKGLPVAVPPPGAGMPPAAAPPMPMPPPGVMGAGGPPMPPPGAPPMGRKAGGRTYRSYKDMDAGAGGGFGRIEKAEIASKKSRIAPQNY